MERIINLENEIDRELPPSQIQEYEHLDKLRRQHLLAAENKCRKLRKGNVAYSDVLQNARNKVEGWSLLLRHCKGLKVSSRKIARTLKKAGIATSSRGYTQLAIIDELKLATTSYYSFKKRINSYVPHT
jgi:hypothetical protein